MQLCVAHTPAVSLKATLSLLLIIFATDSKLISGELLWFPLFQWEQKQVLSPPVKSAWQKQQTSCLTNSYQQSLELILVLIKFHQLKTDSVKQSNFLLQSNLVKRIEDEEKLNSECNIIFCQSIRIVSFALAGAGFFLCPVFSIMLNKEHECPRSLFSFHKHYSEWELHICPWQDLKFRIVLFVANSSSSYFTDTSSYSSYLTNPGPSPCKEDCLQNSQMNWISLFFLFSIIAKYHGMLFSGWSVPKCSCILVPLSAIVYRRTKILLQLLSSFVPREGKE